MSSQIITLTLDAELLKKVEMVAKANYCSRSDYIRTAIVLRLNRQQIVPEPHQAEISEATTRLSEAEFLEELMERYS